MRSFLFFSLHFIFFKSKARHYLCLWKNSGLIEVCVLGGGGRRPGACIDTQVRWPRSVGARALCLGGEGGNWPRRQRDSHAAELPTVPLFLGPAVRFLLWPSLLLTYLLACLLTKSDPPRLFHLAHPPSLPSPFLHTRTLHSEEDPGVRATSLRSRRAGPPFSLLACLQPSWPQVMSGAACTVVGVLLFCARHSSAL